MLLAKPTARRQFAAVTGVLRNASCQAHDQASFDRRRLASGRPVLVSGQAEDSEKPVAKAPAGLHTDAKDPKWTNL